VYGDLEEHLVYREPLDFHHIRRPVQNQSELVGRLDGLGTHHILAGYEYQRDKYRTEVTAGDDPDCLCGYWWLTIAPMDIRTMEETQGPLDLDTVQRRTFVNDRTHSFYAQDQIDLHPQLKVNAALRVDGYERDIDRTGGFPFTPVRRDQTAFTYRTGAVYAPVPDQQIYIGVASAFTPVTTVPADGSPLDPSTSRSVEVGHRWQGWNGRVDTGAAVYHVVRNNVSVQQAVTEFIQVGEQRSKGIDVDVNTALGGQTHLIFNYGFSSPVYSDAGALTDRVPRFVPKHIVNAWLRKDWDFGFNAAIGARHLSEQFVNDTNSRELEAYTIVGAAAGFRTPRWELTLNVDNLANKDDYFLPGHFSNLAFPGPPINVMTTFRVKY
jgi:outer membrane receptor protein involved in Fe transport